MPTAPTSLMRAPGTSQEHMQGRMAAEAAASNMAVSITPYEGRHLSRSSPSSAYMNLAQQSVHAITTPTAQLSNHWDPTEWEAVPRRQEATQQQLAQVSDSSQESFDGAVAPPKGGETPEDAEEDVSRAEHRLAMADAKVEILKKVALGVGATGGGEREVGRLQSLSEIEGMTPSLTDVKEGGQAYVEKIEAQLRDAELKTEQVLPVLPLNWHPCEQS